MPAVNGNGKSNVVGKIAIDSIAGAGSDSSEQAGFHLAPAMNLSDARAVVGAGRRAFGYARQMR